MNRSKYFSSGASNIAVVCMFCGLLFLAAGTVANDSPSFPVTEKIEVTTNYHGIDVKEDYRWLEDFDSPKVKEWNDSQNAFCRSTLDGIASRPAIGDYLSELMGGTSTDYYYFKYRGKKLFAFKFQPPKEQSLLIRLDSADDPFSEQVILDVNELDTNGTTSIDFYEPSPDGRLVAVSLSQKGSEKGTVHVYDVATGKELGDLVPAVNGPTAGGDVAWNADGTGFLYTRYPREGERKPEDMSFYQQVFYHKLGTPTEEDSYSVGKEFPRIAEIQLESSDDGGFFLAAVANGDGGEYAHYLLNSDGHWSQIAEFHDLVRRAAFGPDNSLYLLSRFGAPRGQILKLTPGVSDLDAAVTLVEESEVTIQSYLPTDNYLFVVDVDGGPNQVRIVNLADKSQQQVPAKPVSSVRGLISVGGDNILFRSISYTEPPAWYRFDPMNWKLTRTPLFRTSPADFTDIEVTREFATSKDGTIIPINIIRKQGTKRNGQNPTILYGYGGYGISMTPRFDPALRLWLDQGGVYVVANLRGGGEYGEEWHLQGNLTKKQNVFDDFAACAQYLIENGITSTSRLVIKGGSNGGLLMGAAFTQHPELFAAVVSYVGIYDMLRVELDPNGVFNITEFGTVTNPDHFKALYAYSPYHNVKDNTAYPSVLFLTGEHDGRVNPYQSRKMTARLQAATSSDNPILLRTSASTGHGGGTALSERIEKEADAYAFILDQLGMKFRHDK